MNRRDFLIAAGAGALATSALAAAGASTQAKPILKPRRLKAGDTVGVVTPATATFQQVELDIVRESLEGVALRLNAALTRADQVVRRNPVDPCLHTTVAPE